LGRAEEDCLADRHAACVSDRIKRRFGLSYA